MNNPNQMQMVAEIHRNGPGSIKGQTRAATQGGHIFGGQMGRGYAQMGSKLNKVNANQQKFAQGHDNSLSNGYILNSNSNTTNHQSPKYNSKQ